jgi:predicted DNA-binding protein YlxM (UPF0122 family)
VLVGLRRTGERRDAAAALGELPEPARQAADAVTYGSVFAGIGGLDLGLDRAGMICQWQIEKDEYCRRVLARHWPGVVKYSDVKTCYGTVDLDGSVKTSYPRLGWEQRMAGKLRKLTKQNVEQAVALYQKGLSLQKVADYFSVSRQAMWDLLRRRIPMRSQQRYGEENHFHRGGQTASDRAQNLIEEAIKIGAIKKPAVCQECGSPGQQFKNGRSPIQGHHLDYNKPLEVMWLCQKCHHQWHKKNRATPLEVNRELAPVKVLCGGFP